MYLQLVSVQMMNLLGGSNDCGRRNRKRLGWLVLAGRKGQDEILFALLQQCEMTEPDDEDLPPIIFHSCDYEELKWRDETGNFKT